MIRLIAIDVDGTLLDSRSRVPPANLAALEAAVSRDIQVVIVTGRSFRFALPAVAELPEPLTLIVHNGAITRTRAGHTLDRRLLPRAEARLVLEATTAWRSSAVVMFDRPLQGQMVYDRMDWTHPNRARFHARNREILEEVPALEDALSEDPIQVAFNGSVDHMRAVMAAVADLADAGPLAVSRTEYAARDFSLVDVLAPETTKGTALARLAAALGLDRSEVLAIGDNHNDLEMLAWAGTGVVMGNASAELRDAGFAVTGTNDDAGLAEAVRRFAL